MTVHKEVIGEVCPPRTGRRRLDLEEPSIVVMLWHTQKDGAMN